MLGTCRSNDNVRQLSNFMFFYRRIASLLRERNASLDVLAQYPTQFKSVFGHQLQAADAAAVAYNGPTSSLSKPISPLILAIYHGEFSVVLQLLEKGASVNFPDSDGRTPLMVAVDQVTKFASCQLLMI